MALILYFSANVSAICFVDALRAHRIRLAPSLAKTSAIPSPIPLDAPVMRATLFFSFI